MRTFKISNTLEAVCKSEKTRYGFRHLAELLCNGQEIASAKCCYYNRTWESYEFQSVLQDLAEKAKKGLTTREYNKFVKLIENGWVVEEKKQVDEMFSSIAMVAKMGELLTTDKKQANDWKLRMIKTGLPENAVIMPENWDKLSEDEKQSRLDRVIAKFGGQK